MNTDAINSENYKGVINAVFVYLRKFIAWCERKKGWFTRKRMVRWGIILLAAYILMRLGIYWFISLGIPVSVVEVKPKPVPIYLDFVGITESIQTVDIRARVEGFLDQRDFEDGADVKEGDLLFVIDKRPFQAALDQAKGQLAKDRAALAFAEEQVKRYEPLAKRDFISKEQYDEYVTQAKELKAAVKADKAAVKNANLNLSWCTMRAPFSGRVGHRFVDVGNLVGAGEKTKLATLVQLDPIYVYFSPSGKDALDVLKYLREGPVPTKLVFRDNTEYRHEGTVDFVNNVVDVETSTVTMRATMPNPDKVLLPGVYVTVRLKLTEVDDALLVPQKAVQEDQGGAYVTLCDGGKVQEQHVTLGEAYDDWDRIMKGVKEGDYVIIDRLQIMKTGMACRARPQTDDMGVKTLFWKAIWGY